MLRIICPTSVSNGPLIWRRLHGEVEFLKDILSPLSDVLGK